LPSSKIKQLFKQASKDQQLKSWNPSVMLWKYLSDLDGAIVADIMSYRS
jgi:hypothetical protein